MVDAALATSMPTSAERRASKSAAWRWLTEAREGLFLCWAVIAGLALVGALVVHAFWQPFLDTSEARAYFLAGSTLFWLPLLLLLMDSPDNIGSGARLMLPLATLLVLTSTTVVALSPWGFQLLAPDGRHVAPGALTALYSFIALAFAPRVINSIQFAEAKRKEMQARTKLRPDGEDPLESSDTLEAQRRQHADVEAVGAVVVTAAIALIMALAFEAGQHSTQGLANNAGIIIAVATLAVFGIFVLAERIPDFPPVRAIRRSIVGASNHFGWLSRFYDAIDTVFVRVLAHCAGMEHRSVRARYGVLIATELLLCALAWFLPPPFGLAPAAIGFALAFSISRLWSWVEDDRALAIITRFSPRAPLKVGFREDFRDETLLGFMFALALIPIVFMQMHVGRVFGVPLFDHVPNNGISGWVGYLGFELAKALPIVDWADIYGLSEGADVMHPTRPIGMHTVFAARALVDLVLVSALLQAISISSRNRQQKQLYAYNQIRRVDEIIERRELARVLSRPETDRFADDVIDFRRYDRTRLSELYNTSLDQRLKSFVRKIFDQSKDVLDAAIVVLARLSANRAPLKELEEALVTVKNEQGATPQDLTEIMQNLRNVEGLKEFKESVIDYALQLEPVDEVVDFLDFLMFGKSSDRFKYTRLHAAKALRELSPRLTDAAKIRELLNKLDANQVEAFGARAFVPNALRQELQLRLRELLG